MYCKCQNPTVSYQNKVDFDYNVKSYLGKGIDAQHKAVMHKFGDGE